MDFVLLPEYIAAIFVAIYIANALLDSKFSTLQDILFRISLYATLLSIFFSIITAYSAMHLFYAAYPVNMLLHSAYFVFTFLMITMICLTLLSIMFEERTVSRRFRIGFCILSGLYALTFAAVLINVKTGWLFSVSGNGDYTRGPFNTMTYWLLLFNLLVLLVFYHVERTRLRLAFKRITVILSIVSPIMALYQVITPDTMLTGSIATLALTTILIYGRQQRIHVDHLTGLAGREMFYRTLEHFSLHRQRFHVMFISLRDYKRINSRFGQLFGDELLRELGRYLMSLDKRIVACRYSGVEFALVLSDIPEEEYARLFDTLCERFQLPWDCEGKRVPLSASVVDIAYPHHAKSVNELIASLEYAVRQAKAARHSRIIHFSNELREAAGRFHYLLSQITDTPDSRFFIVLQPVHNSASGLPCGAEALVRMRDENGRTILPGDFIPLAKETGFVDAIDHFVMEQACLFLSSHRDCGLEWLSVNLTPLVHGDAVVEHVMRLLEKYDVPAGMLKLESSVADAWYARSREIIDRMVKTFWKGGRFIALTSGTHEEIRTDTILYYMPLVLGKRLPQEIITKMAADLSVDGDWLTNYGLASEKLTSENFRLNGSCCGGVWAPVNLMILYGLYDAGEEKLAKKIALRYCTAIKDGTFAMVMDPFAGSRGAGFSGSWPATAYVALADLCCNQ